MKYFWCLLFICLLVGRNHSNAQLLDFYPSLADFGTVYSKDSQTSVVRITNQTAKTLTIYKTQLFNTSFYTSDTFFVLQPYGVKYMTLGFSPLHNTIHASELFLYIKNHGAASFHLYGQGRYRENYYDSTQNLSEEPLKNALRYIITKNYNSLGYTTARDSMFMWYDNGKKNGNGDSQNTLECVYTGRVIKGYVDRIDAQNTTTYSFNTEHTWPQSLFNKQEPMLSDMHHLFPVDMVANSTRNNHPYDNITVANPYWQKGGSKYNNGVFEPRDAQKGRAARAMFYVAIRYQNFNGFLTGQEKVLREWHTKFIPTFKDSLRNEAIFKLQKNRNPFIDHPELIDRITNISNTSIAPFNDSFYIFDTAINLSANLNDTLLYTVSATGLGNQTILFTNIRTNLFTTTVGALSCDAGFAGNLELKYICTSPGVFTDIIIMDCNHSSIKNIYFPVKITVKSNTNINNESLLKNVSIYPNPANQCINVDLKHNNGSAFIKVYNIAGQQILHRILFNNTNTIDLPSIAGIYFMEVTTPDGIVRNKIIVE